MTVLLLVYVALAVLVIAAYWVIFGKAGKPGWAAIVPVYNGMVMAEIAGRPSWHGIMLIIPIVNLVFAFMITIDIAKSFGKGTGFGVGMVLLPMIFPPMLAFGGAKYEGPVYQG